MIEQLKAHPCCLCCVRAPLQKSSTKAQAVNAVNPCDGVTKGLLPDKLSVVVNGFLMVERSDVWHREFLQTEKRNTTWKVCSYTPVHTTITVHCYRPTCSTRNYVK